MIQTSIAVQALISWCVIIALALIPKKLSLTEMVFVYFVSAILTVSACTLLDVNLHWVTASRDVEKSLALHVHRFIEIPLLLIISSQVLTTSAKSWRWAIAAAICLLLTLNDWVLVQFDIVALRRWNYVYSFIQYGMFILLMAWLARWFVGLDRGDSGKLGSDRI